MALLPFALALTTICDPMAAAPAPSFGAGRLDEVFQPIEARDVHATPGEPRTLSKREEWFRDKALRPDLHVSDAALEAAQRASAAAEARVRRSRTFASIAAGGGAMAPRPTLPGARIEPITTLFNVWTREALPVLPGDVVAPQLHSFLRDHFTNQATQMDTRLLGVLTGAARKFGAARIEVVSGYRSPKYNLMLRKKGHQVARASQHVEGHAVDFRIPRVPTKSLLNFVRSLRLGGVGFYPHSQFVHTDTGRIRYWTGS